MTRAARPPRTTVLAQDIEALEQERLGLLQVLEACQALTQVVRVRSL